MKVYQFTENATSGPDRKHSFRPLRGQSVEPQM